jgi:hypothetical protein
VDMTQENAAKLLVEADQAGRAVERRAPKEYAPFIGWGLFNAVVIPGFDFFDRSMWGWITIGVAVVGFFATFAYFALRSMRVEVKQRSPWWIWPVLGLWIALASVLGSALDDETAFSYTLAGLIGAVPLLLWGLRLWRRA